MPDYSKWQNLEDSDGEEEVKERNAHSKFNEEQESFRQDQEHLGLWLKKQIREVARNDVSKRPGEFQKQGQVECREVTDEEVSVLSMLMAVSHFEDGHTNLERHPQMLECFRHHRWLEEDPGTLELLCRAHNKAMQGVGTFRGEEHTRQQMENSEDVRMRNMCLSAINAIAAPRKAGCAGGFLELMTMICTPEDDGTKDMRKKWQKKEYAKEALFESLFPDFRKYTEESKEDAGSGKEIWLWLGALLLFLVVLCLAIFWGWSRSKPGTPTMTTTLAAAATGGSGQGHGAEL